MTSQNFIDSNVFIYATTDCPQQKKALTILQEGGTTDALVLIETFSKVRTILQDTELAQKTIHRILSMHPIVPITHNTVFEAIQNEELDIFDAIHAVCAKGMQMQTYDKQLAEKTGTKPIK